MNKFFGVYQAVINSSFCYLCVLGGINNSNWALSINNHLRGSSHWSLYLRLNVPT